VGSVVVAANNAHHSLPSVAGTPTAARPSPMCFALAGCREGVVSKSVLLFGSACVKLYLSC